MTFFVEGIQGSGKSTLVKLLSEKYPDHKVLEEGDYSPVELAWCAYMGMEDYQTALGKHPSLKQEIEAKTHFEDDHAVVCYTKIRTDDRSFYQAMEKYEIYNGRMPFERFKKIVLKRYSSWDGAPLITECALFQNIVEDMILFQDMQDEEIIDFYRELKKATGDKQFHIAYLKAEPDDIRRNLETARQTRVDDKGNEVWFAMLCDYFNSSPHAVRNGLEGEDGLVRHWIHRQELELRICAELFPDRCTVLPSKKYGEKDIDEFGIEIRRFREEDANEVSDVIRKTIRISNTKDYPVELMDELIASETPEAVSERASWTHFYVACDEEKIIGCGAIGPYWGKEDESSLFTIFVLPEYQGKGIGRSIVETLEKDEFFLRAERIEIPASITGVPFYLKMGYHYKDGITTPDEEHLIRLEKLNASELREV